MIGHIGVLAALLEAGALSGVQSWYGCSGGAICALLGAIGVSAGWLRDFATHFQMRLFGTISDDFLTSYMTTWGVNSGEEGLAVFGRFLETWEPGCSSWTFADLAAARPGRRFAVTATNVTRGTLAWFSEETTPGMRILEAVRVSCSIPFFFTPWVGPEGDLYCDGAILEPYPWEHLSAAERAETLVIACSENSIGGQRGVGQETPTSLSQYLGRLVHIMRRRAPDVPRHWIAVNNRHVSLLDFGLSREERVGLFEEGCAAGQRWLAWQAEVCSSRRSDPARHGTPPSSAHPNTSSSDHSLAPERSSGSPPPGGPGGLTACPSLRPRTLPQPTSRRRWSL